MSSMFLLHLACTLVMTGLIWFVQVVHYPLFARIGKREFAGYFDRHLKRTTLVVAPFMLGEVASALLLIVTQDPVISHLRARLSFGCLLVIWLSTATLQIPRHRALQLGQTPEAVASLVDTNWIRTVGWSARSALLLDLLRVGSAIE